MVKMKYFKAELLFFLKTLKQLIYKSINIFDCKNVYLSVIVVFLKFLKIQ